MKSFFTKLSVLLFGVAFAVAGCQDYDEDIRKVNEQLNNNTNELTSQITATKDALEKAINDLKADLEANYATKAELAALSAELKAEIDADVAAAKKAIEDAYKAADAVLKSGYESADKALKAELEQKIADAAKAAQDANDQLAAIFERSLNQLQSEIADVNSYINQTVVPYFEGKIAEVDSAVKALTQTVADLDAAYKAADKGLQANIDAAIAKAAADLQAAKTELTAAYEGAIKTAVDELTEKITANDDAIKALTILHENDMTLLQAAMAQGDEEVMRALNLTKADLEELIADYKKTVDFLQGAIGEGDEEVKRQLMNALNAHIEVYTTTVDQLQGAIADGDEAIRQQLMIAIDKLQTLHETDIKNLEDIVTTNSAMTQANKQRLEDHIATYETTISQLNDITSANEGEIRMLKVRTLALETSLEALEALYAQDMENMQNVHAAMDAALQQETAQRKAADEELQAGIDAVQAALDTHIKEYKATVDLLQGAIAEGDEEVRRQLMNALNAHIEEYTTTVDQLQAAIAEGDLMVQQQLTNALNAFKDEYKTTIEQLEGVIGENSAEISMLKGKFNTFFAEYTTTIEYITGLIGENTNKILINENQINLLKAADEAQDAQIEDLGKQIQTLRKELETYYALKTDVTTTKEELRDLAEKVNNIETEILKKIKDLNIKLAEVENTLKAAIKANTELINATKQALLDADAAIRTAFAEADAKLLADLTKALEDAVAAEQAAREAAVEALKNADAEINLELKSIDFTLTYLQGWAFMAEETINQLRADVDGLLARIQSLVFAPDYTRNVAFIEYAMIKASSKTDGEAPAEDERISKLSLIRYKVNAKDAATEAESLAIAWNQNNDILSYTLESVATSRAAVKNNEELVIHKVESEGEYLYVWVTAENFNECFYTREPQTNDPVNSYAASLRFSDGNNEIATEYVVLAPIDDPMEIEVSIKHDFGRGGIEYEFNAVVDSTLAVNDVETIHPVLEGCEAVLTTGDRSRELTEEELAMFPSTEIAFEEERTYTNPNEEFSISDDSFTFTGEEMTETVQLAEALDKRYVGDILHITRTYTFGPSVATAIFNETLTAEKREVTIVPDTNVVPWTLQRALDLRGDDKTPYSKMITIPAKYEFSYDLYNVFKSPNLESLVTEVTCNGKPTSAWVGLTNYEGTAPNFTVNINLHNYEFPAPGEKPNVYRVVWKATLGVELYVVADLEITLNPRPSTVEITREVPLQLVPGTSYFQAPDALVNAAYVALTPENAGFNTANLAKPNAVLLAALNDGDNTVENTPNYSTNLNFVVGEDDVDNSFVRLYKEQIKGNVPADSYLFERVIDPTWFGVPFIFNVTAKPQLPDYGLIASEDYMKTEEDGIAYVEVFGKINSEGIYTIDLADLGKYLGVTVGNGDDKTRKLEHDLDVEFEIVKGDVQLADNEVAVIPEEGPVAEKSGILRFGQLTADEAVVDWDQYIGTVVDVKATLKTSAAEGAYVLDTKDFQLRTADPLSFEFGDTIRVTRVPGMSASAKVYENVVLKSSVEPSVENLVDQEATSIMEIFAKSHADKTYGIDTEVRIWGVYVDEAMTVPYSSQKWSRDETNGTVTLHADDGQLLYPIYAKATLEFKHNIHGVCTASKDIVIVFEPSADAKVMMNKFTNGGDIKLDDNLLLTQPLVIDNPNAVVTLDLGGKTIQNISKERDSEQYALRVKQGTLIIKGEGTVDGGSGCLYNIALRVDGPAVAYIEGGHFKVGADQEGDVNHCIYAADGGKVFISGGKFQSPPIKDTVPAEYRTLNLKDNTGASIEVTGGEFVNFNPGVITFEPGVTSFVKAGYKATLKQYSTTNYIVVAE